MHESAPLACGWGYWGRKAAQLNLHEKDLTLGTSINHDFVISFVYTDVFTSSHNIVDNLNWFCLLNPTLAFLKENAILIPYAELLSSIWSLSYIAIS